MDDDQQKMHEWAMKYQVAETIKELRNELDESQQAFATRLNISIRALANYEKDRLPNSKTLLKLIELAMEAGQKEWIDTFREAALIRLRPDGFGAVFKNKATRDLLLNLYRSAMQLFSPTLDKEGFVRLRGVIVDQIHELALNLDTKLEEEPKAED